MTVRIVTDSSARLPADLRERYGIRVVPLHILAAARAAARGDYSVATP